MFVTFLNFVVVTEKVYESESTDASDEEILETKQDPLPVSLTAKSTSPDSKPQTDLKPSKQASLMSFFRKN
jgi:hypothetical protein